jgi:signal transduction histidine kinase
VSVRSIQSYVLPPQPWPRRHSAGAGWRWESRYTHLLGVAAALVAALLIDWLLQPSGYPVAAAYGIPLLLAAHLLSAAGVAGTCGAALALNIVTDGFQREAPASSAAENVAILAIGVLAFLLARQRLVSEGTRGRLELQYRAARALAEGDTLQGASSAILEAIARYLGWTRGSLWCIDNAAGEMTCLATWHQPSVAHDEFEDLTQSERFARGIGLPGQVWVEGRPVWIPDVQQSANFPRKVAAGSAALHAGLAFRVRHGDDLLGVIEFFSPEVQQPDEALLALLDAVGQQVGLFLARRRAEDQVTELLVREQAAREAAEAALQERDHVLTTVCHDLRTPLTTIRGQAQLLRRNAERSGTLEPERTLKGLRTIETATVKIATWIDQLLDAARLEAGRALELNRVPTDLVALAWETASEHQKTTERHQLYVETLEQQVVGEWDGVRLGRVLDNLVANAIKYSPAGGEITLSLTREQTADGAWAVVRVRDRGVGIPLTDQVHVFERFRRGANVVGRIAGTGIGLAGAAQIVQQHAGTIAVESREGEGSTFTVRLPVEAPTVVLG